MKTRRRLLTVLCLVLGSAGALVSGSGSPASAACALHTYAPYSPYAYSKSGTFYSPPASSMKITESAVSGTCNNNGTYDGRLTINSNSTSGCGYLKYTGSSTTISNCYFSGGPYSAPVVVRSAKTAPMYLCYSDAVTNGCFSGPWENRGF